MKSTSAHAPQSRKRNLGSILPHPAVPSKDTSSAQQALWVEKYRPERVDQLVVAPKKISEIRQWLQSFSSLSNGPKLLVLTGGPGIGTSFL